MENNSNRLSNGKHEFRNLIEAVKEKVHEGGDSLPARYSALFDGLVDIVEYDGNSAFLIKEEYKFSVVNRVEKDGVVYIPPPTEMIPWLPLPRAEEVLKYVQHDSNQALFDDLKAYHKSISEMPNENYYDLIAAWDFHTYCLESVQYSPNICLFAVPERGKSRTGKGMIYVAHRGMHVESLREAYLLRVASHSKVAIFFDVMDFWNKADKNGSQDIVLNRFEKGTKVPRVIYPDRGAFKDTVYYDVFGPTVIATNIAVHEILETRAIQINMPETSRKFENDVTKETALPLKERLVAFRARRLGEKLPDISKPASGRLGDIMKPILQIIQTVKPERIQSFLSLVRELEKDRLMDKGDSIEAQILKVIIELRGEVKRGSLSVKKIVSEFNKDKSEKEKLTDKRIGRRLCPMGFAKCRTNNGASAIIWEESKIERLRITYGLEKTSETSKTSETTETDATSDHGNYMRVPDVSEVSEDTEVF